jgi:hypothetical protein
MKDTEEITREREVKPEVEFTITEVALGCVEMTVCE